MKAATETGCTGQFYNIATGNKITLNDLLRTLSELYNIEFAANYEATRVGDIRHSYATIDCAKKSLNWKPEVELKQGLSTLL